MRRIKDFTRLYVIYRQCHGPIKAARYAWVVSGGGSHALPHRQISNELRPGSQGAQ